MPGSAGVKSVTMKNADIIFSMYLYFAILECGNFAAF